LLNYFIFIYISNSVRFKNNTKKLKNTSIEIPELFKFLLKDS